MHTLLESECVLQNAISPLYHHFSKSFKKDRHKLELEFVSFKRAHWGGGLEERMKRESRPTLV